MLEKIYALTTTELDVLKKDFEVLTFVSDFDLVYESQVPCTGIALIEGRIDLIKDSKVEGTVEEGHLIGVHQLLGGHPLKYGLRVKAKSKIILLGKSAILALNQNKKSKGHPVNKAVKIS